jgi:hypothetical protein
MADEQPTEMHASNILRDTQNKTAYSTMTACHGIDEKDNQVPPTATQPPIEKPDIEKNRRIVIYQKKHSQNSTQTNETWKKVIRQDCTLGTSSLRTINP